MRAIKLAADGVSLSILMAPYGGPFAGGKDSDGEFFSGRTNFCLDWPPAQRPLLFDHGLDPDVGVEPVGVIDLATAKADAAGVWVRGQLNKAARYWLAIKELLAQPEPILYASSGAAGYLVKRDRATGEIMRWPIIECSLTTTPSNPYAVVSPARMKALKAAGLTLPDVDPPAERNVDRDREALFRSAAVAILESRRLLERRA